MKGVAEGTILEAPRGEGAFGYVTIFLPEGKELTFAEMTPEEKNSLSHRGRATCKLIELLKQL